MCDRKALERLQPLASQLGFGGFMGLSAGYAAKKIGKVSARRGAPHHPWTHPVTHRPQKLCVTVERLWRAVRRVPTETRPP